MERLLLSLALTLGLATFAGMAFFYVLEVIAPTEKISARTRFTGIAFATITEAFGVIVALQVPVVAAFLGLKPLLEIHWTFGSAILATIAAAMWTDLLFYLMHRFEHRFLWRFHKVHHSIQSLSVTNAYHHVTEPLWRAAIISVPLSLFTFAPAPTVVALMILFRWQQHYIHAATRIDFGRLNWLLVGPSYHRIHHSTDPEHHDKNFAAMVPLWDWLFGTLRMPNKGERPDVGLAEVAEPQTFRDWVMIPVRATAPDSRQTSLHKKPARRRSEPYQSSPLPPSAGPLATPRTD